MTQTAWSNGAGTATAWTNGTEPATGFQGRDVTDIGVLMDDSTYTMDSLLCSMDDQKLQGVFSKATAWTNS